MKAEGRGRRRYRVAEYCVSGTTSQIGRRWEGRSSCTAHSTRSHEHASSGTLHLGRSTWDAVLLPLLRVALPCTLAQSMVETERWLRLTERRWSQAPAPG